MKKQLIAVALSFTFAIPGFVNGQEQAKKLSGFYGGVSMRDSGAETQGVSFGHFATVSAWNKYSSAVLEDTGSRTLAFGGYRWANDVALEAAVGSADSTLLRRDAPGARQGVGLSLADERNLATRSWNVDVYTTWAMRPSVALYGRLGYALSDPTTVYIPSLSPDARRNRDGVNYGVGLRYDMTSSLGLRVEYARFGRLPAEAVGGLLPENDQVQFGVQFRF